MDIKNAAKNCILTGALMLGPGSVMSFELLSEGAMGSVSAVSATSAQEILSVAGSSAAGLRDDDDYEALPFQTEVSAQSFETDEVQEDLNFALTQEVETWANDLREQGDLGFQIQVVNELPPSSFEDAVVLIQDDEIESVIFDFDPDSDEDIIVEIGRVNQTVRLLEAGVDNVTYIVERYVERAATINAQPFTDQPSIGSGYISDLRSVSNVSIAAIRE